MKLCIVIVGNKEWYVDIVLPLYYALVSLNWNVEILYNEFSNSSINIVLGAHNLPDNIPIPKNCIIYNFEQESSNYFNKKYLHILHRAKDIWDYSVANIKALKKNWGLNSKFVFPGYVPQMSCLKRSDNEFIDILFYGSPHPRRNKIVHALRKKGLNVQFIQAFGTERDFYITHSKLILNIHYYIPASLEVARLGFLWGNQKAVVSENCPEYGIPFALDNACYFAPYSDIPDVVFALARNQSLRRRIAENGFELFSKISYANILESVIGRNNSSPLAVCPETLNICSAEFLHHCLNIGSSERSNPDIVLDLNKTISLEEKFFTSRYGFVDLRTHKFKKIIVKDYLEYLNNFDKIFDNLLFLLRDNGIVILSLPYIHSNFSMLNYKIKRAFHNSFMDNFCERYWEHNWYEFRFTVENKYLILSDHGKKMRENLVSDDEILEEEGAVDFLEVHLRKRATTEVEKMIFDIKNKKMYNNSQEWIL